MYERKCMWEMLKCFVLDEWNVEMFRPEWMKYMFEIWLQSIMPQRKIEMSECVSEMSKARNEQRLNVFLSI